MRKRITELVCVLVGVAFVYCPIAGQDKLELRTAEVSLRSQYVELQEEKTASQCDSSILFSAIGEKICKRTYDDWLGKCYVWQDNSWVLSDMEFSCDELFYTVLSINNISYQIDDNISVMWLAYPMSYYSHYYLSISYSIFDRKPEITHNSNQQITKILIPGNEWNVDRVIEINYNNQGKVLTINHYKGKEKVHYRKLNYSYLSDGIHCNLFEYYFDAYADGNWSQRYKSETVFDGNEQVLSVTGWDDGENWRRYNFKYNGNVQTSRYDYIGSGNKWGLLQYVIDYYNDISYIPNLEANNNNPVGSDNKGGFDLDVNIPIDSISNGSITIQFPEGFTLDENNTTLTLDFSDRFELVITRQEDNSWLLEIKPKTSKSATLRVGEAKKMIQIAYNVNENLENGTYDISVNSILFETPGGDLIPEPAITVPAELDRTVTGIAAVENSNVWVSGGNLCIRTDKACTVYVYTVLGQIIRQQTVSPGETMISLPQGMYFVKTDEVTKKIIVR